MEHPSKRRLQILTGSYHRALPVAVAKELDVPMGEIHLERFANGEVNCKLSQSARGADVFVFQAHDRPVNDAIMEQAIIIDAAKRASAKRIVAVCPFFGYARQDRKAAGREPITAKLVVDILKAAGADRLVSVDLHSGQIQGFFDGPFDHLTAMPVIADYIQKRWGSDVVVVSPDAGRVKVADRYVRRLNGADLAIVHKRRSKVRANTVEALEVIGDVRGRRCVLIDDMIDTAGTVCAAAEQLKQRGAVEVHVLATHGVFSDPAAERLNAGIIDSVAVADTLPVEVDKIKNLTILPLAPLMAAAVRAIFRSESVSEIFGGENQI